MAKKETGNQLKEKTKKQTAQPGKAVKSHKTKNSSYAKQSKSTAKSTKKPEKNNQTEKKSQDLMFDVVSRFKETLKLMDIGESTRKSKAAKSGSQPEKKKTAEKKADKKADKKQQSTRESAPASWPSSIESTAFLPIVSSEGSSTRSLYL